MTRSSLGSDVVGNEGGDAVEDLLRGAMGEGLVADCFLPAAKGAFFGGIQIEFEPALGCDTINDTAGAGHTQITAAAGAKAGGRERHTLASSSPASSLAYPICS